MSQAITIAVYHITFLLIASVLYFLSTTTTYLLDRHVGRGEAGGADFGPALTARPPRFLAPRMSRPSRFSDLATCLQGVPPIC